MENYKADVLLFTKFKLLKMLFTGALKLNCYE